MIFYHENQNEQINLDKEPLLDKEKKASNSSSDFQLFSNDISIYIDDYYLSKLGIMELNNPDDEASIQKLKYSYDTEISQNLLGIFVVSFDTKLGNIIEWQLPSDLNLEGIEFKAMASGFHLVQNDFVYFCKDNMYGLAAFESIRIENSEERNVRMKSVGLMAKSFKFLKKYIVFLKNQVRNQLEQPGIYESLISLWNRKKVFDSSDFAERKYEQQQAFILNEHSIINKLFNKRLIIYKQISQINQVDYCPYTKFSLYFGPAIFTLWKYVLLNKRIMFYSTPPISDLCSRVLCSCQMINTNLEFVNNKQLLKPFFYVSVMDINKLQQQPFYLACTTEKIFESKEHLYDLFVNDTQLNAVLTDCQKNLLKINSADKKRYDLFLKKICDLPVVKSPGIFSKIDNQDEDESTFIDFFTEQNDRIFSILKELNDTNVETSYSIHYENKMQDFNLSSNTKKRDDPIYLNSDQIKRMGLDPADDRDFLHELIKFYDFNLFI